MATGAASSGSGRPDQRSLADPGRVKVTRLPRCGPKQRSPCQASGLSNVPQPDASASPTWARPTLAGDRGDELLTGEDLAVESLTHHGRAALDVSGADSEVLLPTGTLPRPARCHQREKGTALFGGEQVERPSHRPGLDQPAAGERGGDFTLARLGAADPNRKLGGRCHLCLNTTETPDHTADRLTVPTGSSNCRFNRQASTCGQVTSMDIVGEGIGEPGDGGRRTADGRPAPSGGWEPPTRR